MTPIYYSDKKIPDELRGAIIALGNFDGFHRGHQVVAKTARDWAQKEKRPLIIATFDPHPVRYFRPDTPPFRITTLEQRAELFGQAGANAMLVFSFNDVLAKTKADDFIANLLVDHLGAYGVVTGEDFTFGQGAKGDIALLHGYGAMVGLSAKSVKPVGDDPQENNVISSSRIRKALQNGDPQSAMQLLSRPFTIRGEVIHGDKNGRLLGYPTANIEMNQYLRPKYGIYAVKGILSDGRILNGAANLGMRPSFDPPKELLEPYFFDFNEDLYGQSIEVELHHFLRGEARFDNLEDLKTQMALDCDTAKALLQ